MHNHRATLTSRSPSQIRVGQAHIRLQEPQAFHSPFFPLPVAEPGKESLPLQGFQEVPASRTSPGLGLSYVPITAACQVSYDPGALYQSLESELLSPETRQCKPYRTAGPEAF